ncbi:MAG: DUF4186 family protein [Chloroflexi bacterium]|nr:MAG: DUF4186 family protein [Chloroflexota bacterium]
MTDETQAIAGSEPLQPLKIKCTDANCETGLHCFRKTKKLVAEHKDGHCRYCDVDLINWDRVHVRDLADADFTFTQMRYEYVRHHYWHAEMDEKAVTYAHHKGRIGLPAAVAKRLVSSVGGAQPFRDGYQTPWAGNPIYYAQHATASCCRTCIEEWHGIPTGVALTRKQLAYLGELAIRYLDLRMPDLNEEPEPIRRRRKKRE